MLVPDSAKALKTHGVYQAVLTSPSSESGMPRHSAYMRRSCSAYLQIANSAGTPDEQTYSAEVVRSAQNLDRRVYFSHGPTAAARHDEFA